MLAKGVPAYHENAVLPCPDCPRPRMPSRSRSRSNSLTVMPARPRNRSLSIRSKRSDAASADKSNSKRRFSMVSLRGMNHPDLSKKLYKLIKSENHAIGAIETAGRERATIASQLSEWGEATNDDAISDISDKLGVLMAEIAEQEDWYAQQLEDYRRVLKQIRNTESSVQPSRDHRTKVVDEIQKLKIKEPQSTKIAQLEQELVRAEAQSLVAEAQLTNITRQKFKEAFDIHTAAIIERAEKQAILARQARRLLNLVDDSPIVPGDGHPAYDHADVTRQVLTDAEEELRTWRTSAQPIHSSTGFTSNSTAKARSRSASVSYSFPALDERSGLASSGGPVRAATEDFSTRSVGR